MRSAALGLWCVLSGTLCLTLSACGGDRPPPEVAPNVLPVGTVQPAPIASAVPSELPAPRSSLEKLTQLGVRSGADVALVIDGNRVRASLANELLAPIARLSRELFGQICGLSPLEDLVLGAGSFFVESERIYAAIETKRPAKDWVRCAERLMKSRRHEEGAEEPQSDGTWFEARGIRIEARDEHTFLISPANEGALAPNANAKFAGLTLSGDRLVEVLGDIPFTPRDTVRNIRFDLGGDANALNAHVAFDLPDGKGPELSEKLNEARTRFGGTGSKAEPPVAWLFRKVRYTIQGDHVEASIGVDKSDTSTITSFASLFLGSGAEKYRDRGASEARSSLRQLGRLAVVRTELEVADAKNPGRSKRLITCPPSTPLTPAKVPKGTTYQSRAADWSKPGWKALRFSMSGPQHYAYGINTAPDGKSCTFYAVGDLDGNGKTSRFELLAHVKPKPGAPPGATPELSVAPSLVETLPDE